MCKRKDDEQRKYLKCGWSGEKASRKIPKDERSRWKAWHDTKYWSPSAFWDIICLQSHPKMRSHFVSYSAKFQYCCRKSCDAELLARKIVLSKWIKRVKRETLPHMQEQETEHFLHWPWQWEFWAHNKRSNNILSCCKPASLYT